MACTIIQRHRRHDNHTAEHRQRNEYGEAHLELCLVEA